MTGGMYARPMLERIDAYPTHWISGFAVRAGRPLPFGATPVPGGINFSVFSNHATAMTLILFRRGEERPMAQNIDAALRPRAWVVEESAFPKHGANSVGVAKQYAQSAGRMLNCQLGLAVFLAGDEGSCPVNWRLLVPRSWDDDEARRSRAHLPREERHRPRWQHLLEAVDEMAADWELIPAPIVVDAHQLPQVEPLFSGLETRGLGYIVRVAGNTPATAVSAPNRTPTVGEIVRQWAGRSGTTLSWPGGTGGRLVRSQFLVAPLPRPAGPRDIGSARMPRRQRWVIADWPPGRRHPRTMWLTNLDTTRLPELVDLITLQRRTAEQLARLSEHSGLLHFEGRSFRGWHHHVTLVSAAHGYVMLERIANQAVADDRVPQLA